MFNDLTKAPVPGQAPQQNMTIGRGSSFTLPTDKEKAEPVPRPPGLENAHILPLVDADLQVYAAASVADGKKYKLDGKFYKYVKDAMVVAKKTGFTRKDLEEVYEPLPWSTAKGILEGMLSELMVRVGETDMVYAVSHRSNFRKLIYPNYKIGRDASTKRKPVHRKALTQHLLDNYNTVMHFGMEADDVLGITQCNLNRLLGEGIGDRVPVICSEDKDLFCIPGWHFHIKKHTWRFVSEEEAWSIFCKQVLMGDDTDDIPGLVNVGPVTAEKAIDSAPDCVLKWEAVRKLYGQKKSKDQDLNLDMELNLHVNASMVWICRGFEEGYQNELEKIGHSRQDIRTEQNTGYSEHPTGGSDCFLKTSPSGTRTSSNVSDAIEDIQSDGGSDGVGSGGDGSVTF